MTLWISAEFLFEVFDEAAGNRSCASQISRVPQKVLSRELRAIPGRAFCFCDL
jgi:hypothetical protein